MSGQVIWLSNFPNIENNENHENNDNSPKHHNLTTIPASQTLLKNARPSIFPACLTIFKVLLGFIITEGYVIL